MNKIRLIVTDDHEFFRKGVIQTLNEINNFEVVGEAENGKDLIEKLENTETDVILLDIKMPVMGGKETAEVLKEKYPNIKIIILSFFSEEEYLEKMIKAKVDGFLLKNTNKDDLERAIITVFKGNHYYSEEFMPYFTEKFLPKTEQNVQDKLTKRELEILKEIANGYTNKEIANRLFISVKTVINHRTNIMSKTNSKNTASLIGFALKNKLITILDL